MRFLVRRIYRAFPELDRYSDEQCLRFVRATKRRLWTRLGHRIVIGVVTLLAIGGACAVCAYISERIDSYQNSVRRDVLWVELGAALVCVPMVAIASVAGFIA